MKSDEQAEIERVSTDELHCSIRQLINAMAEEDSNRLLSNYQEIKDSPYTKAIRQYLLDGKYEEFYFLGLRDIESTGASIIRSVTKDKKAIFLLTNYDYCENHFEKILEVKEGSACCADKSRFIARSLANLFIKNKPIVIDYDQEYTFHLPKEIFTTQEEILDFFDAIMRLYYADSVRYIKFLNKNLAK